jgi:hypothetical protein
MSGRGEKWLNHISRDFESAYRVTNEGLVDKVKSESLVERKQFNCAHRLVLVKLSLNEKQKIEGEE